MARPSAVARFILHPDFLAFHARARYDLRMDENPYQSPTTPGARRAWFGLPAILLAIALAGIAGALLIPAFQKAERPNYGRMGPIEFESETSPPDQP
jgi:hypothetical protein